MEKRSIEPIAYIENDFKEKFGIPRQSGRASSNFSKIIFYPKFRSTESLRDIEKFSYLWLIFDFSLSHRENFEPLVRPPRLGGNKKVGVFASRSPFRPNSLGLSSVKLERVEQTENGNILIVSGADLLDKTPIYDIKPYIPFTDCHADAVGGYADEFCNYKLNVNIASELLEIIPKEKQKGLIECLSDDPRPSYQNDGRIYGMKFASFNIKFVVKEDVLTVLNVEKI